MCKCMCLCKHYTGFSTGMWDWNAWIIELDCGTGMWDWNSILAPEPMLAKIDNKGRQGVFNCEHSVEFMPTRQVNTLSKL